jgi:hypothetical protein
VMSMALIRRKGERYEIETLAAFRDGRSADHGVIVIADGTRLPAKAHAPNCNFVKEESFVEKVLTNRGKEGLYYFFSSLDEAKRVIEAKPCGHCAAIM